MFDRPQSGQNVLLVNIYSYKDVQDESEKLEEHKELATSADAKILSVVSYRQDKPTPRLYLTTGRVESLKENILANKIDLVIFNCSLSPSQERNLEREFETRVLDRTGLILDIFAQRARSYEGKLQVELAQLNYLSTRLVRGWTHLERQKGGIGLRGPGETQLETDRRLLSHRVKTLKARLLKVKSQREQGRNARKKSEVPTIALVGYTNAGKSTLFNALTNSNVYQADKLFATLDPTMAQLSITVNFKVILADTVGFVKDLPHTLVDAFQSTLIETQEAHLLIHVIDANDPQRNMKIESVNEVLSAVGADEVPQLLVFNKVDLLPYQKMGAEKLIDQDLNAVWLSAYTGDGLEDLLKTIKNYFLPNRKIGRLIIKNSQPDLKSYLYKNQLVVKETFSENGESLVDYDMPLSTWGKLVKQFNLI